MVVWIQRLRPDSGKVAVKTREWLSMSQVERWLLAKQPSTLGELH